MTTPELVQFVKNEIAVGVSRQSISDKLKTQGLDDNDINEVFNIVSPVVVVHPETDSIPVINTIISEPLVVEQKPRKKPIKFIVVALIVLVLIGGGALAYTSGYITPIKELLKPLFGGIRSGCGDECIQPISDTDMDSQKKSFLVNLRALGEIYYDGNKNSYAGFCSSDLEKNTSGSLFLFSYFKEFKCNDSKTEWASWIQLSNKKYFCTDMRGYADFSSAPKGTLCSKE
jgi:hypothetical protein